MPIMELRRALDDLLAAERKRTGLLPQPDYGLLESLSCGWEELWDGLLAAGGQSRVACALIAAIRDPGAEPRLTRLAWRPENDPRLRRAALIALARSCHDIAETLLLELFNADASVRGTAARELARMGTPGALVSLSIRLADADPVVRRHVAAALAAMGDRDGVRLLLRLLADEGDAAAAQVLGSLAVPGALLDLLAMLHEAEAGLRETAVEALAEIGDVRALPHLLSALGDETRGVRARAERAIEQLVGMRPDELAAVREAAERTRLIRSWWTRARQMLEHRYAYRYGRPRSLGDWIDDLEDAWHAALQPARVELLDCRLAAAMGRSERLDAHALSAEAVRRHVGEWRLWWQEHEARYPAGGWYWQGLAAQEPPPWG